MDLILERIAAESLQGARTFAGEIFNTIEVLERFPRAAPVDETAPPFPQPAASGYRAIAGNYEIRYAFPVEYRADPETIAILLVRDARRDVLKDLEIHDRFVQLMLEEQVP